MEKKTIFIILGILVVAGIAYFFFFRKKGDKDKSAGVTADAKANRQLVFEKA